jgi:DeoR family fructose operon transcriptional repressor
VRSDAGPRGFDRYGFRVPAVIVSPYARPGYVRSEILDHTSVLRLVQEKWNLPPLTRRDAAAAAPLGALDLEGPPAFLDLPDLPDPHASLTVDIMSRLLQHRSSTANIVHLPSWRTGARMLPTQRRQAIITQVRQQAAVSAEDLSGQFAVSVETIRRDLRTLRDAGLLERVYGGATRPSGRSSEGSFAARSARNIERKRAIAAIAASLVEPEETIVIDIGTTALEVARALPGAFRGRVLTNSVPAALELSGRDGIELLLSGGQVRPGDSACSGAHAEAFFAEFYADRAFLGSGGVHPEAGLTDYYPAEVVVRRTIVAHTAKNYVLADSSKLGVIAVRRVCELDQVTAVLTDDTENADAAAALDAAGVTLMRAEVPERGHLPAAG